VAVEHGIGRLQAYRSLADRDRHHRRGHERRVIAVAGLVNLRAEFRGRCEADWVGGTAASLLL
jgi:hypothetical protein